MEEFIKAVKQFPCLWNTELKVYRSARKKHEAWLKVVAATKNKGISNIETAKLQWKKLRDSHRDSLKRTKSKSGHDAEVVNSWKYAELMDFLLPYMTNRNKTWNFTIHETKNRTSTNSPSSDLEMQNDENSDQSSEITDNQDMVQSDFRYAMEEFIKAVRQFPCLWNTELKEYRDARKKHEAWLKIISSTKTKGISDIQAAKAQWKKLRDSHRDSLKRTKPKTGQPAEVINNWKYAELMQFLLPFMKSRNKSSNLTIPETENDTSTDSFSSKLQMQDEEISDQSSEITDTKNIVHLDLSSKTNAPRKRKSCSIDEDLVDTMQEIVENYNRHYAKREPQKSGTYKHPLDSFFESMCTTTKQFPTWLQNSVKRKIFTIVSEAEDTFQNHDRLSFSYDYNTIPQSVQSTSSCDTKPILIQDNQCPLPQQIPE